MFKKSLLIIGLAISLNTQANPFTYKNSLRGMSAVGALAIGYAGFSIAMNKYLTHTGLKDLGYDGGARAATAIGLYCACVPVALLFRYAETINKI